jgi:hypothetical protein
MRVACWLETVQATAGVKAAERLPLQEANPKERQRYFGVLNAKSGELVIF